MGIFDSPFRRKRSHGHRRYHRPQLNTSSSSVHDKFTEMLPFLQKPLGLHHIRTSLFALSFWDLRRLQTYAFGLPVTDTNTQQYKLVTIIADIAKFRLYKPACVGPMIVEKRHFMHIPFVRKGIDVINISNILHEKVTTAIPSYFKNQSVPFFLIRVHQDNHKTCMKQDVQ